MLKPTPPFSKTSCKRIAVYFVSTVPVIVMFHVIFGPIDPKYYLLALGWSTAYHFADRFIEDMEKDDEK